MINVEHAKKFCKDDISKIENYDKAINDHTQTWACHHRDEIRILPSGMTVVRSRHDLNDAGRYYNCPANELIFLTKCEHSRLHSMNKSDEQKQKLSEALKGQTPYNKGKTLSDETRRKMSEARKGEKNPQYGKPLSDEAKRKISESQKANWARRKANA